MEQRETRWAVPFHPPGRQWGRMERRGTRRTMPFHRSGKFPSPVLEQAILKQ
jgi:hypothetical protein